MGELRWRAPQDIESHNDYVNSSVLDATTEGPSCVQSSPPFILEDTSSPWTGGSEDCLLLDVLVPAEPATAGLPVMVQIHGGGKLGFFFSTYCWTDKPILGYTEGNSELVPGNALVFQSRGNLIYVSIQYRLGPYGFLGGAEVTENGDANAGLLDQRAALHWVQRHISAFGGDPDKVTIIGGSAGGGSVIDQLIMYGGEYNPPFWAAIAGKLYDHYPELLRVAY